MSEKIHIEDFDGFAVCGASSLSLTDNPAQATCYNCKCRWDAYKRNRTELRAPIDEKFERYHEPNKQHQKYLIEARKERKAKQIAKKKRK